MTTMVLVYYFWGATLHISWHRPTWRKAAEVLDANVILLLAPVEIEGDSRRRVWPLHHPVHQRLDDVPHAPVDQPLVQSHQTVHLEAPEQNVDAADRSADHLDALSSQLYQLVNPVEILLGTVAQQTPDLAHYAVLVFGVRRPDARSGPHHHWQWNKSRINVDPRKVSHR